jgi:hypothetical protein
MSLARLAAGAPPPAFSGPLPPAPPAPYPSATLASPEAKTEDRTDPRPKDSASIKLQSLFKSDAPKAKP